MATLGTLNIGLYDAVLIGTGAVIVIILMLTILWAMRPKTRKITPKQYNAELFKRRLALDELGYEILHNIKVKDAKGRIVAVDNVIRLPASLLLVTSAPVEAAGKVRAHPTAGEWKYVTPDNRIGTFLNPVLQLHPLISAIRARFPLVRVRVLAVFPNTADFDGKNPKSCCRSDELVEYVRAYIREEGAPSQTIEAAWIPLSQALQATGGAGANKPGSGTGTSGARAVS